MGSSRPTDRSLGEATFLPNWMKGKLDTRFDYTDNTFSPPADDTFFYIRYPRQETSASNAAAPKEGFRPLNEILGNKPAAEPSAASSSSGKLIATGKSAAEYGKDAKNIDFSKHTLPCQSFIPLAADKVNEPKIVIANKAKSKHQTTDDEFRNDKAAECGRSIVHVANQIMSSKFGKANSSDAASTGRHQADESAAQKKASRSLPATPLASPSGTPDSSPKTRRRNRFFTGAFVPDSSNSTDHQQQQRYKNGWLLSSILGQSRELVAPKIEEEDEQPQEPIPTRALSRKKSISSQNLTYLGKEDKQQQEKPHVLMQAKPSELREMNFWSPTSM